MAYAAIGQLIVEWSALVGDIATQTWRIETILGQGPKPVPIANPDDRKFGQKLDHFTNLLSASEIKSDACKALRRKRNRLIQIKVTRDLLAHSPVVVSDFGPQSIHILSRRKKDEALDFKIIQTEQLEKMNQDLSAARFLIWDAGRDVAYHFAGLPQPT